MTPIESIIAEIGGKVVDHHDVHDRLRLRHGNAAVESAIQLRNEVRQKVEDLLWNGQQSLTAQELDALVMSVIDAEYSQYDREAMSSIIGYIGWYSWHEGFMK